MLWKLSYFTIKFPLFLLESNGMIYLFILANHYFGDTYCGERVIQVVNCPGNNYNVVNI